MITHHGNARDSWQIKNCLSCGRKDLPPKYSENEKQAIYSCQCGSCYKAYFVLGEPLRVKAIIILSGKQYFINALSLNIFHGRILLDSKVLQELTD